MYFLMGDSTLSANKPAQKIGSTFCLISISFDRAQESALSHTSSALLTSDAHL